MRASGWGHDYAERLGAENLSGVAIPAKRFEELIVLAYDDMTDKEREKARKRIAKRRGGGGG